MEFIETFEYGLDIDKFSRLSKRENAKKHTIYNNSNSNTNRNILQKDKQIIAKTLRKYREIESIQKHNGTSRTYYCNICNKINSEPCRCDYFQWCGKECDWEYCDETRRLGIIDDLTMPYDVLCNYHSLKYNEYLQNINKLK